FVDFDDYDLLMNETRDALGNRVRVEFNDYRVLQPRLVSDPNSNQTEVVFDALGMVVARAVMGKPGEGKGDNIVGSEPDLSDTDLDNFYDVDDPHVPAPNLLKGATTRIIYDLHRFKRTRDENPKDPTKWLPVYAATLARETHLRDPLPPGGLRIQISFSYS